MKCLNRDFREACRWLADGHNVILSDPKPSATEKVTGACEGFDAAKYERFFEHPWLSPEARRFLFDERRLDERVVRWCRLTSWRDRQGADWLQIPYYNREGRLAGIQNRNLQKGASPRFRFPSGSRCGIYNLPVLNRLQPRDELYITEGASDCWAMLSAGRKAIAIPSATLLSKKDIEQLAILSSQLAISFHMYPDRDEPGERLFLQLQRLLPNLEHHQLPLGCKDFSEHYLATKRQEAIPE
jgi:DNA primase